ncbi:hypothetical protein [Rhizobium phage RHph_X66]|nr:hypothetical protein [Rhizobium phage RHph_X66]
MIVFDPKDPVHAAAKEFREVVKSMFEHKYGLSSPEHRFQLTTKAQAIERLAAALQENHDTTDQLHQFAYQYIEVQKEDGAYIAAGRREAELLEAVEAAMLGAGMNIYP